MGRRADALAELRALDERLAAVVPGPHLEGRILARIRGEKAPRAARAGWRGLARAKRPALVLSFGLATALAVMLSLEARVGGPAPRSAEAGAQEPDGRTTTDPAASEAAEREDLDGAPAAPAGREENEERPLFYERERTPRLDGPTREAPPKPQNTPKKIEIPLNWGSLPEVYDERSAPPSGPARSGELRPGPAATPFFQSPGSSFGPMRLAGEREEPRRVRAFGSLRSEPSGGSPSSAPETPIANSAAPAPPKEVVAEEVCQSSSAWKLMASAECEADGLVLYNLTLVAPCGADMYGGAKAECAKPASDVNEDDPAYCEGLMVGDGTSCELPEHWKKLAYDSCLVEGLNLVDVFYHQDCSDGKSTAAKVLCCTNVPPPEPDPPPPSPCVTVEMFPACIPPVEVEVEAKEQCAAQGMTLSAFKFAPDCEGGGVSHAAFMCCP